MSNDQICPHCNGTGHLQPEKHGPLVKTSKAVELLGVSRRTLHRWISIGVLTEGRHFFHGLTPKSPLRWDVQAIEAKLGNILLRFRESSPSL